MFDSLTERLQGVFKSLARRGKLRPEDIDSTLHEIRLALLEADVHFQVVTDLVARIGQRALGEEVSRALNPAQQVIRIVHEELVVSLGKPSRLLLVGKKPRSLMLVGLQGSGKTTTAAKLALWLRQQGERVWLVAADVRRPAAVEQLLVLGEQIDIPVFHQEGLAPEAMSSAGVDTAAKAGASVVLLDTAGRSQIDQPMMDELLGIKERTDPVEILLIADAMTGQDAVNIASGFHERLGLTGLILTKMDGDARGGAAISIRTVTGVPIKFVGTGEASDALQTFEPDRLASRILGMGDVLSLIEKAEATLDADQVEKQAVRIMEGEFSLDDFADQLEQVRSMGPIGKLMEMMPGGLGPVKQQIDSQAAERQLVRTQAILRSMTIIERRKPEILNASRKRRIAAGSGTSVQEVNQLLRQFRQMRKLFKRMGKRDFGTIMPGMR